MGMLSSLQGRITLILLFAILLLTSTNKVILLLDVDAKETQVMKENSSKGTARTLEGHVGILNSLKHYEIHQMKPLGEEFNRRRLSDLKGSKFLQYDMEVFGRRLSLDLERMDDLFTEDFKHVIVHENGHHEEVVEDLDCFYKVRTNSEKDHFGKVSLCGPGMHGMISMGEVDENGVRRRLHIHPLDEEGVDHAAFRDEDVIPPETPRHCGVGWEGQPNPTRKESSPSQSKDNHHDNRELSGILGEDSNSRTTGSILDIKNESTERRELSAIDVKLRVGVVNDKKRFDSWGVATHAHSALIMGIVKDLFDDFEDISVGPSVTIDTQIAYMYTWAVPAPWETNSAFFDSNGRGDADDILESFGDTISGLSSPTVDVYHLFSGHPFQDNVLGLAWTPGACGSSNFGITTAPVTDSDALIASTVTHEIGHNLDIKHTNVPAPAPVSGTCNSPTTNYIMDASSSGTTPHVLWSNCCKAHFDAWSGRPNSCLQAGVSSEYAPFCGDGIVQGDEECDCPFNDCSNYDPCCNGNTCQLSGSSECSAVDGCCTSSCTIRPSGHVCRPVVDAECDTEEVCNGSSGKCPEDEFESAGTSCSSPYPGTCFHKRCVSRQRQCQDAFGLDACSSQSPPCGALRCEVDAVTCSTHGQFVETGVSCGSSTGCYFGECIPYGEIRVPGRLNCTNGVADGLETDVDCGGPECFGCPGGKQCLEDSDCISGQCNMEEDDLSEGWNSAALNGTLYGICENENDCVCSPCCPGWLEDILRFFRDNITIIGPILGGAIVLLLLYCCWPSGENTDQARPKSKSKKKKKKVTNRSSQDYKHDEIDTYPQAEFA